MSSSCLRRKCRDTSATNSAFFTFGLSDNSKCIYSKVAFYNSKGSINNSSVSKVDLFINQSYIGEITQIYPNGIGNCTATGTVSYLFTNGHSVDWEAKYTLLNGNIVYTNGTVSPDSSLTCMSQDVYK
jgi:hypothetical protein